MQGVNVDLILATRGRQVSSVRGRGRRRRFGKANCTSLGVRTLDFLGFPDGQLTEVPDEKAIGRLVEEMRRSHADVVIPFGPEGIFGHPDHVAVSRWTTMVFDHLSQELAEPIRLYYIVPSEATQQSCGVALEAEAAGGSLVSIDIDAFRIVKVRAMRQHKSQNPLPFREELKDAAAKLACHEVFRLARPISTDNRNGPRDDLFSDMDDQLRPNGYIIGESLC